MKIISRVMVLFVLVVCFPLSTGSLYALSSSGLTYVRCCPEARTTGTFIAGRAFPSWWLWLICGNGGKQGSGRFPKTRHFTGPDSWRNY